IVQKFEDHIVELYEANVQSLLSAPQIRNSNGSWVDLLFDRFDLGVQLQGVVNLLAMEIAVPHDFRSAQNRRVKLERAIHVLHGHAKMLEAANSLTEWSAVIAARLALRWRRRSLDSTCRCH